MKQLETLILGALRELATSHRAVNASFDMRSDGSLEEEKIARDAYTAAAAAKEEAISRLTHLGLGLYPARKPRARSKRRTA